MRFPLFEVSIQRRDYCATAYVVAPSQDAAWMTVIDHEEELGLGHEDLTIRRFDDKIDEELELGLDTLLETAPVGFASFCDLGWVAHTAPVQQLKLFRTIDRKGGNVYAIAPNIDIAVSVFTTELRIPKGETRLLHISDGTADLPPELLCNLPRLLEFGPVGIAVLDAEEKRWSVF